MGHHINHHHNWTIYWILGVIGIIILILVMMIIWYGFWLNKKFSRNHGEEQAMVEAPVRVAIPPIVIEQE